MVFLYKMQAIRAMESLALQDCLTEDALMQRAGAKAWDSLRSRWPNAKHIMVVTGKGHNAGDGYILAQAALAAGCDVQLVALEPLERLTGTILQAARACCEQGAAWIPFNDSLTLKADVIVDAMLGIGCQRAVVDPYASAITRVNQSGCPVFSLDIPSGLNADTGQHYGCAVHANATITFLANKVGLYVHEGRSLSGQVECATLGIAPEHCQLISPWLQLLDASTLPHLFPKRKKDTHKGDFGHVLVIGGDYGMGGAVLMAAEAAMRVGAGLVTVATRPEHLSCVTARRPEIMCAQVENADQLAPLIERSTVIVIGPGLGQSDWAKALFDRVVDSGRPLIVDADGLNLLASYPKKLPQAIITPHPGEAARLLGSSVNQVQADRYQSVLALQSQYSDVAILKGAGTLVQTDTLPPALCAAGNPGMATGGMGDILSGVIGGLLAQQYTLTQAAQVGVLIHSMAADQAASQCGERGLLASDLLDLIRALVNPNDT